MESEIEYELNVYIFRAIRSLRFCQNGRYRSDMGNVETSKISSTTGEPVNTTFMDDS